MGIAIVGEIPVTLTTTTDPAVLVRNIVWDMTVGSYTHHLHTHAHVPSSGNYAEMIRIESSYPLSSTCSRVLLVYPLTMLHGLISMSQSL